MTATKKLIVGASASGLLTAERLAAAGHDVTVVSRRGTASGRPGVKHLALDAADAGALARAADGAATIFNCAMPRYDLWPQEFPPLAAAVLAAAEATGADLVTLGNVYGYGRPAGPLKESTPLAPHTVKGGVRARMWEAARTSRARATEVRASDFLGRGVISYFTLMVLPGIQGRAPVSFPGDLDAAHSWSFTNDVVATLIAASQSDQCWGRAWHVPSSDMSVRALAKRTAQLAGAHEPQLQRMPMSELEGYAANDSIMREVVEMTYLFDQPCLLDSAETQKALGVRPTPIDEVIKDTLRA